MCAQVVGCNSNGSPIKHPSSISLLRRTEYESRVFHHSRTEDNHEDCKQYEHYFLHPNVCHSNIVYIILYSRFFIYTPIMFFCIRSEGMPDYVWDYYQTTLKMSSYLVACLVSEFEDVATTTSHRVPFRLWVKPESRDLAG